MANHTLAEIAKPLELAPGFFYIPEFSATGGVKYAREGATDVIEREDESLTARYKTRKDVDHVGLVSWSKKLINSAYGVMERHASQTPVGYWISADKEPTMLAELVQVKEAAKNLNKHAAESGSARRCKIEVWKLQAGADSLEAVAVRLAETVRDRLQRLISDLREGDLNAYSTSWKLAKNLPRLATGIQAESIALGLEAAKAARAELAEAIRAKTAPSKAGAELDLTALESAVYLFTDSVNGTLATVEDPDAEIQF